MFSLDTIKTLLQQHLQGVEAMLQPHVVAFVSFLENEETKAKAEIQHLQSLGYTIIHPANTAGSVVQAAPAAAILVPNTSTPPAAK